MIKNDKTKLETKCTRKNFLKSSFTIIRLFFFKFYPPYWILLNYFLFLISDSNKALSNYLIDQVSQKLN